MQHIVDHEFGHVLFGASKTFDKERILADTFMRAKRSGDINQVSQYAKSRAGEFFAEVFAMHQRGDALPGYIIQTINTIIPITQTEETK